MTSVWIVFHVALLGRVELTHPRALSFLESLEYRVYLLEVFVPHFAVVPGRVVFGEVVRKVELAWGPGEIELALADAIFHPPVMHVERFG